MNKIMEELTTAKIVHFPCAITVDDPDNHRWRAWWGSSWIELRAYPVIKRTPFGAWIDEMGFCHDLTINPEQMQTKRFVQDGSARSWAKLTREGAIQSLVIRASRHTNIIFRDAEALRDRAKLIRALLPEHIAVAEYIERRLAWLPDGGLL